MNEKLKQAAHYSEALNLKGTSYYMEEFEFGFHSNPVMPSQTSHSYMVLKMVQLETISLFTHTLTQAHTAPSMIKIEQEATQTYL